MSVLIKGMKMPKDCPMCPCAHWNKNDVMTGCEIVWRYIPDSETDYWQSDKRPGWCPLVEVPFPHGRLIDGDNVIKLLREQLTGDRDTVYEYYDDGLEMAISELSIMPTIIEAEGETHEHTH